MRREKSENFHCTICRMCDPSDLHVESPMSYFVIGEAQTKATYQHYLNDFNANNLKKAI